MRLSNITEAPAPKRSFFYVLKKGDEAKVVPDDADIFALEDEGWNVIWDSARSPENGYAYALQHYGAFPHDSHGPKLMTEPKVLYRSVSLPEIVDIFAKRKVVGKQNSFNSFDTRRWVFFGDKMSSRLIGQGEEVERQASTALDDHPMRAEWESIENRKKAIRQRVLPLVQAEIAKINRYRKKEGWPLIELDQETIDEFLAGWDSATWKLRDMGAVRGEARKMLDELAKLDDMESKLREKWQTLHARTEKTIAAQRKKLPYTSAIIVTKPLSGGVHYSQAHGKSGMGDEDEYGFAPGQVTLDDIDHVIFVKNGKSVISASVDQARDIVDEIGSRLHMMGLFDR